MEIKPITSFLIWICLFGGMHSQEPIEPTPNMLVITKIILNPATIDVHFTVDHLQAPENTVFVLIVGTIPDSTDDHGKIDQYPMQEDSYSPDEQDGEVSATFTGEFTEHQNENIYFTIHGDPPATILNTNYTRVAPVEGIVSVNLGAIPSTAPGTAQWVGEQLGSGQGINHGNTLRTNEVANGWKICGNDDAVKIDEMTCESTTGVPCYAINIGSELDGDNLFYCDKTDDDKPIIVKKKLSPNDVSDVDGPDLAEKRISLDYSTTTITTDLAVENNEAFVYKDGDQSGDICTTVIKCLLTDYTKGDKILKIVFNTVADGAAIGSTVVSFQDVDIHAYQLVPTVLESRWTHHADAYLAEKSTVNGDSSFHYVDANCEGAGVCYAYFVNIEAAGDYTVTTKPVINDVPDETNAVTSLKAPVTTSRDNKATSISEITLLQDPAHSDGVLQACYKAHGNNNNYTRYEAVLIDDDGNWMKIYESKHEKNMTNCFSPVNVLETSLSVTNANKLTVVIIERELSGNRVLASGKVDLDITALRAIKPEVDNGNNGSSSTLAIVGAAIAGIACLMALVAAAVMFVMKINRDNDGLENQLHRYNIEDSSIIHGLDNPIPTM